jgi:uncharacterized protein YjbJ (UPF0337 family)
MTQEMRGKVKKLKGQAKEAAGIIVGDRKLEKAGAQERAEGAAQESVGKVRRKAGELVEEIGAAIRK